MFLQPSLAEESSAASNWVAKKQPTLMCSHDTMQFLSGCSNVLDPSFHVTMWQQRRMVTRHPNMSEMSQASIEHKPKNITGGTGTVVLARKGPFTKLLTVSATTEDCCMHGRPSGWLPTRTAENKCFSVQPGGQIVAVHLKQE